jgi:hypothetical protein
MNYQIYIGKYYWVSLYLSLYKVREINLKIIYYSLL